MTDFAAIRAERHRMERIHRRERMVRAVRIGTIIVGLLLAFGLAGSLDMCDRQANLTTMLPTASE